MIDELLVFAFRMLVWLSICLRIGEEFKNTKRHSSKNNDFRKGDKDMFDKKIMRMIKAEKIGEFMMKGQQVFMVMPDGSLVEINEDTDVQKLFFHSLRGGAYAVFKKRHSTGAFAKTIKIGRWSVTLNHEERGGDQDVFDAR